jgi:hypothetical protein
MVTARDYPTEEELKKITDWPPADWGALLEYVKSIWWLPEWGWDNAEGKYHISTGGWSGNEEIIEAMSLNRIFWSMCWRGSRAGGHFEFQIPELSAQGSD